jgi:hypothetical protein
MRFIRGGGIARATNVLSWPYPSRSRAAPAPACLVGGSDVMEPLKGIGKTSGLFLFPTLRTEAYPSVAGRSTRCVPIVAASFLPWAGLVLLPIP